MESNEKLLPCPFCGKEAHISHSGDGELCNIRCTGWSPGECLGAGPNCYSVEEAIAGWNKRSTLQCLHQIQEPSPVLAAQPEDMRDKVTLALGLSLPPKGAPHFAWSYLLGSIRDLVKCEEELILLKVGKEMSKEIPKAAPAAVAVPEDWMEHLGFELDAEADGIWQLIEDTGARREATLTERVLWKELIAIRAALAAAPAAEGSVSNVTFAAAPVVLPEPAVIATSKRESPAKGSVEFTWGVDALKEEGEHKLFTEQQLRALLATGGQAQAVAIPPECPHLIWYDDQERRPEMFAGSGAKAAAARRFAQISQQWNAHLFVRVDKNSRDCLYPVATVAAPQAQADARDDSALLDAMERQRIAVVPEYEGPWDAEVYNDEGKPNHRGTGATPREAIRAAIAAAKGV